MPRGRRRASTNVAALEEELNSLKARQAELRAQLRKLRGSEGETRKLEEKAAKQLASAKWVINQIRAVRPDFDEAGFYQSVQPKQPTPRGRRPRTAAAAAAPAEG